MKFNDSIFSYLQEITANPVPTHHITSMDEYKSELEKLLPIKHPFDFVEFEECDLLRAAFLFQTKISGGGTRKEKIIHAFKDAACKIANGEEFTGFRLDTQDHFGINLKVHRDGDGYERITRFYKALSDGLKYRQSFDFKINIHFPSYFGSSDLKVLSDEFDVLLSYVKGQRSAIAYRLMSEELAKDVADFSSKIAGVDWDYLQRRTSQLSAPELPV